jgi:hypothetical protein
MIHHQEFSSMFGPFKRYRVTREAQSLSEAKDVRAANWRSILNQADASRDSYRAALVVLNVKLICEFAPFVRDRSEYENFRHRAIDLAMSIQDEAHRNYALKLVEELSNAKRRQWEEDGLKTQLKGRERPKWLAQASRDLNRNTPLIVR